MSEVNIPKLMDKCPLPLPDYYLVTSQEEYNNILEELKPSTDYSKVFIRRPSTLGVCKYFMIRGKLVFLICIRLKDRPIHETVGILAHEATHMWQRFSSHIGEREPSIEFEAYYIGHITKCLVEEYNSKIKADKTIVNLPINYEKIKNNKEIISLLGLKDGEGSGEGGINTDYKTGFLIYLLNNSSKKMKESIKDHNSYLDKNID